MYCVIFQYDINMLHDFPAHSSHRVVTVRKLLQGYDVRWHRLRRLWRLIVHRNPGNACPVGWLYPTGEPPGQCWFTTWACGVRGVSCSTFPPTNCSLTSGMLGMFFPYLKVWEPGSHVEHVSPRCALSEPLHTGVIRWSPELMLYLYPGPNRSPTSRSLWVLVVEVNVGILPSENSSVLHTWLSTGWL